MCRELRPHHGMCFQFYEGKGYSEEFTGHMGRVLRELEADPSQTVRLTAGTDVVCGHCPNNTDGLCTSQEKVARYDREVLEACGLADGEELSYERFIALVRERVIDTGRRSRIWGDCSWDYICSRQARSTR